MGEPLESRHPSAGGGGWRPGSRVERIRASHSYAVVLALVAAIFLFIATAPAETWSQSVIVLLTSVTLGTALWASGLGRDRPAATLFGLGLVAAIALLLTGGATATGLVWLLDVVLVVATIGVIGLGIFDQREINRKSVTGAICVYLLLGILFTFVYGAVAALQEGDFFAQGTDGTPGLRLYFSYVTLATLGYGDYTPAASLGQTLAITEALLGQLYLVTVVALLVGHFGQAPRAAGVRATSVPLPARRKGR